MMQIESKKMTPSLPQSGVIKHFPRHHNKKVPPFGKYLINRLTSGEPITNGITIFIGEPKKLNERIKRQWYLGKPVLLYPPYEDVASYCWDNVAGYDIDIFDQYNVREKQAKQLALALLNSGAKVVRYINRRGDFVKFSGGVA